MKAELHEVIKDSIPSLIQLLGVGQSYVQSDLIPLFIKLAAHGEFIAVYHPDRANAGMKSSFARRLGPPFHY